MTRLALRLVLHSSERDWRDSESLRILGLRSLPAAIVRDIVKPPYHLDRMAIAFSQRKHELKRMENDVEDELSTSGYGLSCIAEEVAKRTLFRHRAPPL